MRTARIALCASLLCLASLVCAQAPAPTPAPGKFELRCARGLISVSSNEASVEQMLMDFSQKSGVVFNKFVGKTRNATMDLKDAKYEEFLGRVLGSYVAKSKKVDGVVVVSSVTVMDEGAGESSSPPPPPPPAHLDRGSPEAVKAREELLKRRRRRRRRPFRGQQAPESAEPGPSGEVAPPEVQPPPDPQPPDQPPPEQVPQDPPPSDQPPPGEPPPPENPPPFDPATGEPMP